MKKVYVERHEADYERMWERFGWTTVRRIGAADVIQFTGGEDVHPHFYGEEVHPKTYWNSQRDEECVLLYEYALQNGIPMAGICRGGQFLNCMNGGKMHQHCDGHGIYGVHKATILSTNLSIDVSSTHHQIMRPNRDVGIVLMEANPKLGTFKKGMEQIEIGCGRKDWIEIDRQEEDDVEAVFYPNTQSLCFQPHCEYMPGSQCEEAYRFFLRNELGIDV